MPILRTANCVSSWAWLLWILQTSFESQLEDVANSLRTQLLSNIYYTETIAQWSNSVECNIEPSLYVANHNLYLREIQISWTIDTCSKIYRDIHGPLIHVHTWSCMLVHPTLRGSVDYGNEFESLHLHTHTCSYHVLYMAKSVLEFEPCKA